MNKRTIRNPNYWLGKQIGRNWDFDKWFFFRSEYSGRFYSVKEYGTCRLFTTEISRIARREYGIEDATEMSQDECDEVEITLERNHPEAWQRNLEEINR